MMNGLLSLHKETLLQEVDPAGSTLFMPVHLTNSIYAIASYSRAYSDTSIRAIDYEPIFIKANRDKGKILLSIYCTLLSSCIVMRNAKILILRVKSNSLV